MLLARSFLVLTALSLVGCGTSMDGSDVGPDTATPPGDGGTGYVVDAPSPMAPAAPELGPCPDGWRALTSETGVETCEPWPESGPATCAADEIHLPGHAGCEPIGSACPAGDFPADLPTSGVLYVLAGATSGDGSEALPFGTIAEATAVAISGDVIAVGAGDYSEEVTVPAGVTLRGACATRTVLSSSSFAMERGVITVGGPDVTLRDLSVGESGRPGIWIGDGATAQVEGVIVDRAFGLAVMVVLGGRMTASRIIVRDTEGLPGGSFGRGLNVEGGGVAEVSESLFERNRENAVAAASAGSIVRLDDCVVRDTQSDNRGLTGRGLNVQDEASAEASRTVFEQNRGAGILVGRLGATLTLDQVVVRDTNGQALDGEDGDGLVVQFLAEARVTRSLFERNSERGIMVAAEGATLEMSDVVVRDTQGRVSDGERGAGLVAHSGGSASVTRGLFEGNRQIGVGIGGDGTLTLEDVSIRGTQSQLSDGLLGRGLNLQEGSTTVARRVFVEDSADVGVYVASAGTTLSWVGGVVRDTRSRTGDLGGGRGIVVQDSASADLAQLLVERCREVGVLVLEGSTLTLNDVAVLDVQSRESDGRTGRGLSIQSRSTAMGSGILLERLRDHGIYASGAETTVAFDHVNIHDIRPMECGSTTCVRESGGSGIGTYDGATVSVSEFAVSDAALCGVRVTDGTGLDLIRGEVYACTVGACVPTRDYDIARLQMDVSYSDNGANLDSTVLPVPTPLAPGEEAVTD
jgi:hypothetical protein